MTNLLKPTAWLFIILATQAACQEKQSTNMHTAPASVSASKESGKGNAQKQQTNTVSANGNEEAGMHPKLLIWASNQPYNNVKLQKLPIPPGSFIRHLENNNYPEAPEDEVSLPSEERARLPLPLKKTIHTKLWNPWGSFISTENIKEKLILLK